MKKIGIIGGIGPESTIQYYRMFIKNFQDRFSTSNYPEMVLHSIDMIEMLGYVFSDNLQGLTNFLMGRISILEATGVDYIILASNTPHIVFDELQHRSDATLISIVEETCKSIATMNIKKVGLFGTKSTMSKGFYQKKGMDYSLEIAIPTEKLQNYIHEKYMGELVFNNIVPETKKQLIEIAESLKKDVGIEGLILGGTELPLILEQSDFTNLTIFNTTEIHVNSMIDLIQEP